MVSLTQNLLTVRMSQITLTALVILAPLTHTQTAANLIAQLTHTHQDVSQIA